MMKKWIAVAVALAMMAASTACFAEDIGTASEKAAIEVALHLDNRTDVAPGAGQHEVIHGKTA